VAADLLPAGSAERIYRTLFDANPDALIVASADGRILLANPSAQTLLGYAVAELVGMQVDVLVPDAIRPRHSGYRAAFGHAPVPRPMGRQTDLVARRKDGTHVAVEIALSPLQDHGQPLVVAAIRDVAAYPRMKQALRRAEYSDRLAQIGRLAVDARDPQIVLDAVPVAAVEALDVELAMVYLLEASALELRVASMAGIMPGEAIGDRIANRPDTSLGVVLASGRSINVADYRLEARFKVPATYLAAGLVSGLAVPLSDRGRTIGVLAVRSRAGRRFGDDEVRFAESLGNLLATTLQRARSEESLNHAQRLESVGQLTGGIAHDFNNLLTVIQGNLQVLADIPGLLDDVQARPLVDAAARASRRGAALTGKLLAFSRRQVLQPVAIEVSQVLGSLADLLRRTLDQRIGIEVDARDDALAVLVDPGQLESALLNIAINARDAMPHGGLLKFRAVGCTWLPAEAAAEVGTDAVAADFVELSIADEGTGMADDVRERVFEPFFTTKDTGRGTGLGLSTVYGFVRQSRGAVLIESRLGAGTTVTLYLPRPQHAAVAVAVAAEVPDPASMPALSAGLGVLLVEDDAEVREVMRRFLESLACRVTEAASGEQALLAIDAGGHFDVLLSDIALGAGLRGTEVASRAQALSPSLAVVLMSGYSAELLEADSGSPPEWELLRKPCSREELSAAMARVISVPR